MLKRISLRIRDMGTIKRLIEGADAQANLAGEEAPGAEHFVLSALQLEDASAQRVFSRLGIDDAQFRDAIAQQYTDALSAVGIHIEQPDTPPVAVAPSGAPHVSKASGQALMKALYVLKKYDKDLPLLSAHVLRVAANIEQGVVPRAFRVLGVDRTLLIHAVQEELDAFKVHDAS